MWFNEFKRLMQEHIEHMLNDQDVLFETCVDKDALWETYLESFPDGTNSIFRERREHDCSCCKQFIRNFGHVVAIDDDHNVVTVWDFHVGDNAYQTVADALSVFVKGAGVNGLFLTPQAKIGVDSNHEMLDGGDVRTWEHFFVHLPDRFVFKSRKTEGEVISEYRATKEVFKRSLEEISVAAVSDVLDWIGQNNLYRGEEWQPALSRFLDLHKEYHSLQECKRGLWCWKKAHDVGGAVGKIRNHSIGVLLTNLSDGMDADDAVRQYERIVAPTNYKRPKALFSKKKVEEAKQTVSDLGFMDSLGRRFAVIDDITINNILFADKDVKRRMEGDVFASLQKDVSVNPKSFDRVEEVPAKQFAENILPSATRIEAFLENRQMGNMVSLIAPKVRGSKTMFKWGNNFSWAYSGNIADSMKERVKAFGGNVEGVIRFSLQWNDDGDNQNDFDAHCVEPNGNEIFFGNKRNVLTSGALDVDIIHPIRDIGNKVAVENITWGDINRMLEGEYVFYVHNYSHRGGRKGFSAEIEYDGDVHSFEYNKELRQDERVKVATVQFNKRSGIRLISSLSPSTASKTVWGVETNRFHPVSVCMFSPNYWDKQSGIGNRHYFFMLDGCVNDTQPNGFFNEFLKEELMPHKRVFEALGAKMRVDPTEEQLSGVGFSSTRRNYLVCKVEGDSPRTVKVMF